MAERHFDTTMRAVNGILMSPRVQAIRRRRFGRTTPIVATLSLLIGGSYVAYQRIGTVANADLVEYTENLAGGFLAMGMTDDQPGFVLLSDLDRKKVKVKTDLELNWAAGKHTVVRIATPQTESRIRLRRPVMAVVLEDGSVTFDEVDLSRAEFEGLRHAADCSFEEAVARRRCGAPFADIGDYLAETDPARIPAAVRSFLRRHAWPKRRRLSAAKP